MSPRRHGQIRRSQVITTYGPGALIDLPRHSGIVGGLDTWPRTADLEEIEEPRLAGKLQAITGVPAPKLYAPPPETGDPAAPVRGIGAWRFPEWFLVQEANTGDERQRSRRLVHRLRLDDGQKFDSRPVVAIRFVRACPKGHVDDIDWHWFVHGSGSDCPRTRQLWLDERGTGGYFIDLVVRCECGTSRGMHEATQIEMNPLGPCSGARPWLGRNANEDCNERSRLLTRTGSNSWFPQVVSVLSLPDRRSPVETAVRALWDDLQIVKDAAGLDFMKQKPRVAAELEGLADDDVLAAIRAVRDGAAGETRLKPAELDALLAVPEGYGDDVPVDPDFHARRLPDRAWRRSPLCGGIEAVVQVHRLREVLALVGFTRLEPVMPDVDGEYDTDVARAAIAEEPNWFPAVENRGEGLFVLLRAAAIRQWLARTEVKARIDALADGHRRWLEGRRTQRDFPGGTYVLLHTLSHLLLHSLAVRCGYSATSIRERIYADATGGRFGLLLYTASPDAEGTLGGLVAQARHFEGHLRQALGASVLCSNDPICALHAPGKSLEARWLHGAACHGCSFVAETSCEMRNDYLDRALVVPVVGLPGAAFFNADS